MALIGHSGSGKTFLGQHIVDYHLGQGAKAVRVLDRGHSFDRLAKYHDGTIFGDKINPLQFRNPYFLVEFLSSFIPHGEISYKTRCLLFKAIKENIDRIGSVSELFDLIDGVIPNFSLYFERDREFFTDEEVRVTDITYVDTRRYSDGLLRPLFIYLMEYAKGLEGRKVFVFEECWNALRHNVDYIGEFFRTSRALGISCIAITQRFDDLLASELGRVIAENTFFKIIFSVPQVVNEYLDEDDLDAIANLKSQEQEYSEFYLKAPFTRKTLRYYPTVFQHERFTSHFEDRKKIDRFVADYINHFDYKTLIQRWTEVKYGQDINQYIAEYKSSH